MIAGTKGEINFMRFFKASCLMLEKLFITFTSIILRLWWWVNCKVKFLSDPHLNPHEIKITDMKRDRNLDGEKESMLRIINLPPWLFWVHEFIIYPSSSTFTASYSWISYTFSFMNIHSALKCIRRSHKDFRSI